MHKKTDKPVLVTGATGYVAGRLIPLLLDAGYRVRAMGRTIEKMAGRPWGKDANVELVTGDIMDTGSLQKAVAGCGTIYYLVHSMISRKGAYRDADKTGAANMVRAAADQGAEHIIYLGGLGDIHHKNISKHLVSRNEVGNILQSGPVPGTVLRAAMILGSGSASFEILRYLAERLPVMITPKDQDRCELTLLSRFLPTGILGIAYWYALYPFHQLVFSRMLSGMATAAGKTLLTPPIRFTPKITNACSLPPAQ